MSELSDENQIVLLPSNCVATYEAYTLAYTQTLEMGKPKLVERAMYAVGFNRQVDISRARRLRDVANKVDRYKNDAIKSLNQARGDARTALITAENVIKDTNQTISTKKAREKILKSQLKHIQEVCSKTIDRVKSYLGKDYSSEQREWMGIRLSQLDGLLTSLSPGEEVELREEWEEYTKILREYYETQDLIQEAQQKRKAAYAQKDSLQEFIAVCDRELESVSTNFEFIKLGIQAGQIKELDLLLEQKLSLAKKLIGSISS